MSNTWMVVTGPGETAVLAGTVHESPDALNVLAIGPRGLAEEAARVAGAVSWIDAQEPAENYAGSAGAYLAEKGAQAVVGFATSGCRAAMGAFAQAAGASAVSNVVSVSAAGASATVEHTAVDNRVIETLDVPLPAVLAVDTLGFKPGDGEAPQAADGAAAAIEQVDAASSDAVELVETVPVPPSGVETADYVVGVGRGVATAESFENARALADQLGAELSGSMPGVRDFGFFPDDAAYIGLSGVGITARAYFALGISGSTPHMSGLTGAQKVVCINNDANARLFDHSDYGIVGDVDEVVPALTRALAQRAK